MKGLTGNLDLIYFSFEKMNRMMKEMKIVGMKVAKELWKELNKVIGMVADKFELGLELEFEPAGDMELELEFELAVDMELVPVEQLVLLLGLELEHLKVLDMVEEL